MLEGLKDFAVLSFPDAYPSIMWTASHKFAILKKLYGNRNVGIWIDIDLKGMDKF